MCLIHALQSLFVILAVVCESIVFLLKYYGPVERNTYVKRSGLV